MKGIHRADAIEPPPISEVLGEQLVNAVTAPPFNSLPLSLTLGAPPADIVANQYNECI